MLCGTETPLPLWAAQLHLVAGAGCCKSARWDESTISATQLLSARLTIAVKVHSRMQGDAGRHQNKLSLERQQTGARLQYLAGLGETNWRAALLGVGRTVLWDSGTPAAAHSVSSHTITLSPTCLLFMPPARQGAHNCVRSTAPSCFVDACER